MDTSTRQATTGFICLALAFITLELVIWLYGSAREAYGRWVHRERATNRVNSHLKVEQTAPRVMKAYDPSNDTYHAICSESCADLIFLDYEDVGDAVVYPRSCEHCYNCGKLAKGTYENGCVVHHERDNPRGLYCKLYDFSRTRVFEDTLATYVEKTGQVISDGLWDYTVELVKACGDSPAEALADLIISGGPGLYE